MIAVVGDYNPRYPTHVGTSAALRAMPLRQIAWIGTDEVRERWSELRRARGIFVAPGSPYRDMDAALDVIRYARERGVPLVGT